MKQLLLVLGLFICNISLGHRGDFVAIENVEVFSGIIENKVQFKFDLENIRHTDFENILIELVINDQSVDSIEVDLLRSGTEFVRYWFVIDQDLVDLDHDKIQIEITELFGVRNDWGGWDNPVAEKQVNTLYSEFYADAPWRMMKNDSAGNMQGIPVHFFLHDADLIPGINLQVDNINLQLKNATDSNFGPVLTYDSWQLSDLQNQFTCMSEHDGDLDIKEFDINSFSTSASQTFDFDIDSDLFDEFVEVTEKYWYFTFTIPPSDLIGYNDVVDILVTINYSNFTITEDHIGLRVFRVNEDIPSISGWFRGDTHLHSMYTQSDAEIGLPLCSTKAAAQLAGLDWITTTDHTSDFDNYGTSITSNWFRIKGEASALNSLDSSLIYIAGQEVAANNSADNLVHMLAYPNPLMPEAMPFLGDGHGDLTPTSVSLSDALNKVDLYNGFAYAAHPFATGDQLPAFPVDGGIWNIASASFPDNGMNFPLTGGSIVCNTLSEDSDVFSGDNSELVKNRLKGAQVWNMRNSLVSTGDENDPWDVQNTGSPFSEINSNDDEYHFRRFRQGQEIVNHINQLGLQMKNSNSSATNWKLFYSAGSDAHGSFNYSNTDDFAGIGVINSNAVGKLATVVYCPEGMSIDGQHILEALESGTSTLSDGPVLTIGVSTNGDDGINEVNLGKDTLLNSDLTDSYFVNIDYATTQEFGDVTDIDLIFGTEIGEITYPLSMVNPNGSNSITLQMNVLLENVFGIGNEPNGEYFYMRGELATFKDYNGQFSEYLTSNESFHSVTNPIWLKLDQGVALNALSEELLAIYPNPAQNQLYLDFKDKNERVITVFDQTGRKVMEKISVTKHEELDITNLVSGMYHIRLNSSHSTLSTKFIKK